VEIKRTRKEEGTRKINCGKSEVHETKKKI
jgi:hypothetical protein